MELQRLTHFDEHGLVCFRHAAGCGAPFAGARSVCVARCPRAGVLRRRGARVRGHWIESEDWTAHVARGRGLLSEASIAPDKRLSTHPALLVRTVSTGEVLPFSRLVAASEVVLPVVKGQRLLGIADDVRAIQQPVPSSLPYRARKITSLPAHSLPAPSLPALTTRAPSGRAG
jgi:hypothetical protein